MVQIVHDYLLGPDSHQGVHPVSVGEGVVVDHLPAVPLELVIEELVSQCELDSEQEEVEEFACHEVAKVPGVVMENCLEIFDKFLDHRLLNNPVIILGILTDHHLSLSL